MFSLWLVAWIVQAGVPGEHLQRALQLHLNGEIAAAVKKYRAYLEDEPNDVEAQSNPGTALVRLGRTSFWTDSSVPGTPETTDTASVTLGLKFSSDVPGAVTGIRFYKGPHKAGTHVANMWSSTGTKLAEITFSGETASGWQQANFSSAVNIAANTTYVISYLAPKGYYACDQNYSWATLSAAPLHVSGAAPGVFAYGSASTFPTGTWNGSNYWVDLVFVPSTSPNPSLYTISGSVSGSAATLTLSGAATGSTTTDATGKYTFSGLANGSYVVTASQSGYAFTPSTASVTVKGAAITGVNFTATAVVPVSHSVTVNWTASTSSNIVGYNVYRGSTSGGPYTQIGFIGGTSYVDANVSSGQTYFYVVTAVDGRNKKSAYSTQATAVIPTP
jgi:hypothetical protein